MGYQLALADALRDYGLPVVEVNGWRSRGSSSFSPRGAVNHHTAGARRGILPSLSVLINGHGTLPGPLCNVAQSRSTEGTNDPLDRVYVIAAGRANHAGSGGWRGLSGNSSVFGLEIEHTGVLSTEPWPTRRAETAYRVHAALADLAGYDVAMICQHKEWAPSRKIDFVAQAGDPFRAAVVAVGHTTPTEPTPPPPPPPDEEEHNMQLPAKIVKSDDPNAPHWWVTDGITRQHIPNRVYAGLLINQGFAYAAQGTGDMTKTADIVPHIWPGIALDAVRIVGKIPA